MQRLRLPAVDISQAVLVERAGKVDAQTVQQTPRGSLAPLLARGEGWGEGLKCLVNSALTLTLIGGNLTSSLPGLTRQSIDLRKNFLAKKMDARVKPAHDELAKQLKLAPMTLTLFP